MMLIMFVCSFIVGVVALSFTPEIFNLVKELLVINNVDSEIVSMVLLSVTLLYSVLFIMIIFGSGYAIWRIASCEYVDGSYDDIFSDVDDDLDDFCNEDLPELVKVYDLDKAKNILKMKYANGEISSEVYTEKMSRL